MTPLPEPEAEEVPAIGILALDTAFPRPPGDIGNPASFPFPVRYRVIPGATVARAVTGADEIRELLPDLTSAARELEAEGVRAITTTCGFLAAVQRELAAAVSVPVATSSLLLVPMVRAMTGGRPVGVVTAHSGHLSPAHLAACGADPGGVRILGMETAPAFRRAILAPAQDHAPLLDADAIGKEVVDRCRELLEDVPEIGAIVFECTNLQPYAPLAQAAAGVPIFGIYHLVNLLQDAAMAPLFTSTKTVPAMTR